MDTLTQPLRDEHHRFAVAIRALVDTADAVDELPLPELRARVDRVAAFLTGQFLPHTQAEERAVYPLIHRVLGSGEATRAMTRQHLEVRRLSQKLAALRERLVYSYFGSTERRAMSQTLYELHAVIQLHVAEEDEIFLSLLDRRISAAEAIEMVEGVQEAERQAAPVT